jgi:hypothetical protein
MTTDTYEWPTLRQTAIEAFGGDYPRGEQEQAVIDAFTEHPRALALAIEKVGDGFKQGRIRVPWAVLKKEAERILTEPDTLIATDTSRREKAIECGRRWIVNAGLYFDREEEVREELFERRSLRVFADDTALVEEMLDLWRAKRGTIATAPTS